MKCAYHPTHLASVHCSSCGRALCVACDHRIKGYPHCQDCIVAGIDMLRRASSGRHFAPAPGAKSSWLALILGLIPGLGAAYNGQNVKALVHFTVTVGLMTLSDVFDWPLEIIFGLGGVGFYCYSLYDAFSSATRQRNGENLQIEDDRLKEFLRERTNVWGALLIALGGLAGVDAMFPNLLQRFWPLVLIAAGLYFLHQYQQSRKEPELKPAYRTPPPSVISSGSAGFDRSSSDFARAQNPYDR